MVECTNVEVHYSNVDAGTKAENAGVYTITDMQIDPDDAERAICTWLISRNATQKVGLLKFSIRFTCVDEDANILYSWNTGIFSSITVLASLYNSEKIIEKYADVLAQWKKEIESTADAIIPYIGENGNWVAWDIETGSRIDTGIKAEGTKGDKGDSRSPILAAMMGVPDFNVKRPDYLVIGGSYEYEDGVNIFKGNQETFSISIPVGLEVPKVLGKPINVRLKIDEQTCKKACYTFSLDSYQSKVYESVHTGETLSFTILLRRFAYGFSKLDESGKYAQFQYYADTGELGVVMQIKAIDKSQVPFTVKISDFVITVEGESPRWFIWDDKQMAYVDSGVNAQGEDGYTPLKGTDYWTEEDKAEIKAYVDEAILGGAW
jgi:hypothetical protein